MFWSTFSITINIPQNKIVYVALQYIHGIGEKFSNDICSKQNIVIKLKNGYNVGIDINKIKSIKKNRCYF